MKVSVTLTAPPLARAEALANRVRDRALSHLEARLYASRRAGTGAQPQVPALQADQKLAER